MTVLDHGARPVLNRPSGGPKAPREVDIAARADALHKAPERLERGAPDEHVPGRHRIVAKQAAFDAEEVTRPRISGQQASLSRVAHDRARDCPAVARDRLGEIGVNQAGSRDAVGVHEHEPVVGGHPRARVAGVVGGALGRRPREPHHRAAHAGDHSDGGVVGHDQLIGGHQPQARERLEQSNRVSEVAEERDHDADRWPGGRPH
jgi:hypothetical protein